MAIGSQQGTTATAASVSGVQPFVAVSRLQLALEQGDGWCCRAADAGLLHDCLWYVEVGQQDWKGVTWGVQ